MIEILLNGFATLFVIIDPIGLAPIFLGLTPGMTMAHRRRIARNGCLIAFGILAVFSLTGLRVIETLGISLGAFRIAGGLFLFWIAFELVFEKRKTRKEKDAQTAMSEHDVGEIAAVPLAIPLMAGPGAISAVILLSGDLPGVAGQLSLLAVIAVTIGATFAILALADRFERLIGQTGRAVITRLLGVLLAALAVQFVSDGVKAVFLLPAP
ncbi:MarC family protein [Aureimonas sp. ME7]|uniref:MarC family protein n=1 Tax=Aureimonas sp. ME7 TaxID=2744252 RepID=UPI0015F3C1F0|nr:MarC family protein [Aureimonas sp. ME7]